MQVPLYLQSLSVRNQLTYRIMKRSKQDVVVNNFSKLDFHDDGLLSIKILPPRAPNNLAQIRIEFKDDSTGATKLLSFDACANFRFNADFDVLADNWRPGNTKASIAKTDIKRMKEFVLVQMPHWRTTYMPPQPKNKPIKKKLRNIRNYILFRITFFGGTAEILAKNYRLKA